MTSSHGGYERAIHKALTDRWANTDFAIRLDSDAAELSVSWIDGPTAASVGRALSELQDQSTGMFEGVVILTRGLGGAREREQVVARIEEAFELQVPRTVRGDIDWRAAALRELEVPVFCATDSGLPLVTGRARCSLATVLREVFDSTDFD
ncbi:hypothetical protein AB0N05_37890 [Nocardia sp. NPDC051030]|uniref:hypothetical protein n=1 Tax=Nocardia sp. NPDC051030 TaxID=3155162 RepID=UPI0034146A2A